MPGQNNYKGPLDYIDVAARIVEFRTKHPEGSLQQVSLDFREFGGSSWVIFTAAAYRTATDERPGIGTAWEPVPGKTNFTRDSELQNAETAAWGRAIVAALAADTKKGIASAEEIRNRQSPQQEGAPAPRRSAVQAEPAASTRDGMDWNTVLLLSTTEQELRDAAAAIAASDMPQARKDALRGVYDKRLAELKETP